MTKMNVVLLGAQGQLGSAISASPSASDHDLIALSKQTLDITNPAQLHERLEKEAPDIVINAAAYTAVDKAETDQENAYLINAQAPEYLGAAAKAIGFRVIHISTDFVFDGNASTPYSPEDGTAPLSIYGKSKLAGETALLAAFGTSETDSPEKGSPITIIRTSWLYSATHPCFLTTMLRLMTEKPALGVVADQVGTPTSAGSLAKNIWQFVDHFSSGAGDHQQAINQQQASDHQQSIALQQQALGGGIYHWSDAGVASWYDFAHAIQSIALDLGKLDKKIPISPLRTEQYPTPATRPRYSVMDKRATYDLFGIEVPTHWCEELVKVIQTLDAVK